MSDAHAEEIFITISTDMNEVLFDGKWSNWKEWKRSSLNTLEFNDESVIHLRTAHQDNFVYIMIDFVSDTQHDRIGDKAIVCFDTKNEKNKFTDENDFCFMGIMDRKEGITFQGGGATLQNGGIKKISNDKNFIAIGTLSDENDRYSKIPHASYEFRIPTDVIGRSSVYGFYFSVFDSYNGNWYSWPGNEVEKKSLTISSPSTWGEIISPDKTLPEFQLLYIVFILSIISTIVMKFKVSTMKLN